MSYKAARGFYLITNLIEDLLIADEYINTVTYGDISDVDLNKQTIFPLGHLIVNSITSSEQTLTFNVSILAMDLVNVEKKPTTNWFRGNTNEQDVLNAQFKVLNKLLQKIRIGDLYREGYQIIGDVSFEPFTDRFENLLAGWAATFDVMINNDQSVC
jgi:hypothetical protein